jgi:hypothetical protein
LTQLKVTDRQEGEHLEVFELQAGDLVITDRANGLRQRIVFVLRQAADVVVRFTPHNLPLQEASGKALDVVRWLKGCHAPAGRVVSRDVWISYQGQQFAVRCIGLRLSEEQRKAAQRRKQRRASKKQQQVQADTLYLAGWVLLITTLQSRALECTAGAALVSSALAHRVSLQAHQTTVEVPNPALYNSGDGPAYDHSALVGMGFAGRREHSHSPGHA